MELLNPCVKYEKGVYIIPDFAVDIVARRRKPWRNVQLERFYDEGISIDMLRSKIVKQAVQQALKALKSFPED